jgi:SAM-dependent methyltransferase
MTTYDERLAGDYWGRIRFQDVTGEDEAVLGLNRPAGINRAYGDWELHSLDRLLPSPAGLALDVGAGVGRVAAYLASRSWSVVAVDVAPGMVDRCRANLAGVRGIRSVLQASALALPFEDGDFDLVVCLGVIEHLPERLETVLLAECLRVLRPRGRFLLEVNNGRSVLLRRAAENPYRTGQQLSNGYLCRLVDPEHVIAELEAVSAVVEDTAVNPCFSLMRHSGVSDDDVLGAAVRLDLHTRYRPVGLCTADQVMFSVAKPA